MTSILLMLCFLSLPVASADRSFPVQTAGKASSIRVNGSREITESAVVNRILAIISHYDSWTIMPECRSSVCNDVVLEWMLHGSTVVKLSLCGNGTRARVGEPGPGSPCGRRVPDLATKELLSLLRVEAKPE